MNNKSVCRGLLCRKSDRKFKCRITKQRMCNLCSVDTKKGKVSIDQFFGNMEDKAINDVWKDINKDFVEMLNPPKKVKNVDSVPT